MADSSIPDQNPVHIEHENNSFKIEIFDHKGLSPILSIITLSTMIIVKPADAKRRKNTFI